jgi:hypothetical protein
MRANQNALTKVTYRDPEPLPECIRHALCPKCGKKVAIERVPWTTHWDVFCITCSRVPLPEGYIHDTLAL